MKNWQVIALCFSIIASVAAATFYLKYEPKTIIESNDGAVDLGKVLAERVMVDVTLIDYYEKTQSSVDSMNFYDRTLKIDESTTNRKKLNYNKMSPDEGDRYVLLVRTYILYSSSNFMNAPYSYTVAEKRYSLPKDVAFKKSVKNIINKNFDETKSKVANSLFITDKVAFGLEEAADTK